jgi:hypothetical protein
MKKHTVLEEARREGLEMAKELLDEAMQYFHGIYLITPFSYYAMTAELTRYIKQKGKEINLVHS